VQAAWTTDGNWSGIGANPMCCGDDIGGEYTSTAVWGIAGPTACCPSPNQCYSARNNGACVLNQAENTDTLCKNGVDDDCDGFVDSAEDPSCAASMAFGYVFIQDSQGKRAAPTNAVVTLGNKKVTPLTQKTDPQTSQAVMYYEFTDPTVLGAGTRLISAGLFGYTTESANALFQVGLPHEQNFTLTPRLCNDDCTNNNGFCDTSCIGVGACQPTTQEIITMQACHPQGAPFGLKPGQEVIIGPGSQTGYVSVGVCCALPPQDRLAPKTTVSENPAFGKIDTLVKYTTTVIVNGKPYKFVVNTW
jgi:hypothetical protein